MPAKSKKQSVAKNTAKAKPKASAGISLPMPPPDLAAFGPAQPGLPQPVPTPIRTSALPRNAPAPLPGMQVAQTPTGSLKPVPGTKLSGKR